MSEHPVDKLNEIQAKISMIQRLFLAKDSDEFIDFNAQDSWGVDLVLGEISDQLVSIKKAWPTGVPGPKEVSDE